MNERLPDPGWADELARIVGADNVLVDRDAVEAETRTCIPFRQIPECVVYPGSVEEVQQVVRVARARGIPIWPVSTGKNWGYGEKSATYAGGITMVLNRMRRIESVDPDLGYAVIEPGVTYHALNAHLRSNGIPLWTDSAGGPGSASIIGNALDKGRGLTPYADHFGALCGMEVVLADGSLLRTGNTREAPNRIWNLYKWGVGPYLDGLFAQSNFGIVVKAGVWLMPAPEAFDFLAFEYTGADDRFPAMIDDLRRLVFQGALTSRPHLANDFAMLCIVAQYPKQWLDGRKSLGPEAMARWRKQHGVSRWTFGCGAYGTVEQVRFQRRTLRRVLGRYGRLWSFGRVTEADAWGRLMFRLTSWGARLTGKSPEFLAQIKPAADLFRGIPTDEFARQVYFRSERKPDGAFDPARDGCGFIWIGPVVPFKGDEVRRVMEMGRAIFAKHDFDFFLEVIVESPRAVLMLFGVFYERADPADAARANAWYEEMRAAVVGAGYPPYRETAKSTASAIDGYPRLRALLGDIKQSLDPQGVIAPQRYGIDGSGAARGTER